MEDYGCDPIENGMYKMIPSGDIVDYTERCKRLKTVQRENNDCFGMSWRQIAMKQGGLNTLDITRIKEDR